MTAAPELGAPTTRRPPFKYSARTRVWFSDTDAQGIVYYGRYLPYFDLARVEYLRELDLLRPAALQGYEFAAFRARDDLLLVTATQTLVLVDLDERKAVPIPESYKDAIRAFEGDALDA